MACFFILLKMHVQDQNEILNIYLEKALNSRKITGEIIIVHRKCQKLFSCIKLSYKMYVDNLAQFFYRF